MAITISDGTTTVNLPDDLFWEDQHNWSPVEQTVSTSITGAAIIDVGTRINGRGITLRSTEEYGWLPYATVSQLKTWADTPGKQLSLTLQSATFNVIFRHHDKPAIDVFGIIDYNAPDAQDWFFGVLKFTEV